MFESYYDRIVMYVIKLNQYCIFNPSLSFSPDLAQLVEQLTVVVCIFNV